MPVSAGKREVGRSKRTFKKRSDAYKARTSSARQLAAAKSRAIVGRAARHSRAVAGSSLSINRMKDSLFPEGMAVKLHWAREISFSPSASGSSSNLFKLNSLYDPDITGVGGQPRYFDTLFGAAGGNAPYLDYMVYACKIAAQVRNTDATSHAMVSLSAFPEGAAPTDIIKAQERSDTQCLWLSPTTGGNSTGVVSQYVTMSDLFGITDLEDELDLRGAHNADPTKAGYGSLQVFNPDGAGAITVNAVVTITFYAKCYGRVNQADS